MWLFFVSGFLVLGQADGADAGQGAPTAVQAQMRSSFQGLMALQPYLSTPSAFADPKNKPAIVSSFEALSSVKHAFPKKMAQEEPGVAAISHLFSRYLDETRVRFEEGDYDYARNRLRTVTGLCLGCHGQMKSENDFVDVNQKVESLSLTPLERADYLAATRQFDLAMQVYQQVLTPTPSNEMEYFEFLRALRHALSLSVRVKQDSAATLELLTGLSTRKDLPPFLMEYVQSWKADAFSWHKDVFSSKNATSAQLLKKAQTLVNSVGGNQALLGDDQNEIIYLRATGYLREALKKNPKSPQRAEALFLLGICYAELQDPSLWELDALYLETCVRENPHTPMAQKCLKRLTDRVFLGYTGSRGTQLPEDEVKRLGELRDLAKQKSK